VVAIALTSVSGAPGVTTLAVALAHQLGQFTGRSPLVIEADPDGGVLAIRHHLALAPGLIELAGAARVGIDPADVAGYAQPLQSGVPVVVAHPSSDRTAAALRASAVHISTAASSLIDHDTLIDIGRARPGSPALPLVEASSIAVFVVRPRADEIVVLLHRIELLEQLAPVFLVLVGSGPYGVAEVEESTGLTVLGVVLPAVMFAGLAVTVTEYVVTGTGGFEVTGGLLGSVGELVQPSAAASTDAASRNADFRKSLIRMAPTSLRA